MKKQHSLYTKSASELSPKKKRIFFFITVSLPFVCLLLVEVCLRIFHYGPNLDLFTTEQIAGKTYHVMNPDVKARYFPSSGFTPSTSPDYFLMPKPAGTYRIFCLGGSTTIGFPYGSAGSFSAFLSQRLKSLFPEKSVEIINLGMTATNSYTAVDMAREVVDYAPDLIIVYDGHNEFYGALGVASNESPGGSRLIVKAFLRLIHVRSFLLLRSFIAHIKAWIFPSAESTSATTMMEKLARGQQVPYGSATYRKGLEIFLANLEDLKEIFGARRIPVILSTQVSNLRDQSPFVSDFQASLSTTARSQFEGALAQGLKLEQSGSPDSALAALQAAKKIDSLRADVRYTLAQCLDKKKLSGEALREYTAARDYDQLRFRTSSDFNDAIRRICDDKYLFLADAEQLFAQHSPDSLIGKNLILEHLHPNTQGYFLLAKGYCNVMKEHSLLATAEEWQRVPSINDEQLRDQTTITEIDELSAQSRIAKLTSNWPFKPGEAVAYPSLADNTINRIVQTYISGNASWEETHVAAAEYYEQTGRQEKAAREYQALMNRLPLNVSSYLRLGQLYARMGRFADAQEVLARSLAVEQTHYAYQILGQIDFEEEHWETAISNLEKAFRLTQTVDERADAGYRLAIACVRAEKPEQAVSALEQVVRIKPQLRPAQKLLQQLKAQQH